MRASWYGGIAFLNMFSLDDMFGSLLLMLSGMFVMMFGGWLCCLCTYRGVLFGSIYGLCSLVFKSIVMSRKSTIFRLALIMISALKTRLFKIAYKCQ